MLSTLSALVLLLGMLRVLYPSSGTLRLKLKQAPAAAAARASSIGYAKVGENKKYISGASVDIIYSHA